jgi:prepilin-type N-terminal cleavage/methylation domain-containing protein
VLARHQIALRPLWRDQRGLTIVELLVVLIVIAVLLGIAVPSYLGFKERAEKSTVATNVQEAVPALRAFYHENDTYVGATLDSLRSIDAGIASITLSGLGPNTYTLSFTMGDCWASLTGPGGSISTNC